MELFPDKEPIPLSARVIKARIVEVGDHDPEQDELDFLQPGSFLTPYDLYQGSSVDHLEVLALRVAEAIVDEVRSPFKLYSWKRDDKYILPVRHGSQILMVVSIFKGKADPQKKSRDVIGIANELGRIMRSKDPRDLIMQEVMTTAHANRFAVVQHVRHPTSVFRDYYVMSDHKNLIGVTM